MSDLLEKIQLNYTGKDRELLISAYRYAEQKHATQKRASGEAYFIHPCAVAEILIDLGMDTSSIAAAFLHDVIEDTDATPDDIKKNFGTEILSLVDGVTKLDKIYFHTKEEAEAENFRKIFVAMANDIRVIIIKLADRLHNMRSLDFLPMERRQRIAQETLDIYTPLAGRLGISQIKCELEDLCLKYLDTEAYNFLSETVQKRVAERQDLINDVLDTIKNMLADMNISGEVFGRAKHLYSIYKKMKNKQLTLDQVYDLSAVRVIVNTTTECYEVMGKIHSKWKPVPGRIKDYIAVPKRNLYKSLHTTVVTHHGHYCEIQIRTFEMHRFNEYGIAAHWRYKENKSDETSFDERLSWIRDAMDWQGGLNNSKEFIDTLKNDLYTTELLVFTPHGKVISLPLGGTPVDFAYNIHSAVGNRCVGAKVNGRMVALNSPLKTGDVVEILTSANSKGPSWDWLKFVKSSSAKAKIRQFFKKEMKEENIRLGKSMLEVEAKRKGYSLSDLLTEETFIRISERMMFASQDEMFASVGYGAVGTNQILFKLIDYYKKKIPQQPLTGDIERIKKTSSGSVTVKGASGLLVKFAHCCSPVPGDDIVGFVSRGRGVIIHRKDCVNLSDYDPARLMPANWTGDTQSEFIAGIRIIAEDTEGLVAFITGEISLMHLAMTQINGRINKEKQAVFDINVILNRRSDLDLLINHIKKDKRIIDVFRTSGQQ